MKIYIDSEYRCHTTNTDDTFREVETDVFDGKCDAFIEGYRYIPAGESWIRSDGKVFRGEMTAPWKDYHVLDGMQRAYELGMLAEYEAALSEIETALGVG